MKFYYLESPKTNPHHNLSIEEYLLDNLSADSCVFYLWQNDKTVVIGKNQEAKAECNLSTMRKEGITLARRCTGGGAVYHDLGNLNFSFLLPNELYDVKKQLSVIVEALKSFGIEAEISGRNDLTVEGAKISGNAFITRKTHSLHHGTLLIDTDFSAMSKYLSPSVYKLRKKAISSVKSRVVNLTSFKPIAIQELKQVLRQTFAEVYNCRLIDLDMKYDTGEYLAKHQDESYLYGSTDLGTHIIEGVFDDSYYKFSFNSENKIITDLNIYTDSLKDDTELLLDYLPGKNSEEIVVVLKKCLSPDEAKKISEEFEVLLKS